MTNDVQTLLRRGASPQLVAALIAKGTSCVHAMAVGSDVQLRLVKLHLERRR